MKYLGILCIAFFMACGTVERIDRELDSDFDGIPDFSDSLPFDTDNDGIKNEEDEDQDGDNVPNANDAFPLDHEEWLDTDQDGLGNNRDLDDDEDHHLDTEDVFPLDAAEWNDFDQDTIGDEADADDDNDGIGDLWDDEPNNRDVAGDPDGDGLDSLEDTDDDGDGFPDSLEIEEGSDPFVFPSVPKDQDGDGLTDRQEEALGTSPLSTDGDSDGLSDPLELSLKSNPNHSDTDGDTIPDGLEYATGAGGAKDYDGDGVLDLLDFSGEVRFAPEPPLSVDFPRHRVGVAWNGAGDLVFADFSSHTVKVVSKDNVTRLTLGAGILNNPNDVALDSTGRYWVADTGNHRIVVFDAAGQTVITLGSLGNRLGEFDLPRGIALNAKDTAYVADTVNHRIQVLDNQGGRLAFGSFGPAAGQFNSPMDVAVGADGKIYVADTGNYRVQVFSATIPPAPVLEINAARLGLSSPTDLVPLSVAISPAGEIFIVNSVAPYLLVVDAEGRLVRRFGSQGNGLGSFQTPLGIALDRAGRGLVSELYRLQIF